MPLDVAYLKDGPCDGKTHTLTTKERKTNQVVCKGWLYQYAALAGLHNGDEIFIATGPYVNPKDIGKAAHLHSGYHDVQRSVNSNFPASLRHARRALTAGLRHVHRASKVRL